MCRLELMTDICVRAAESSTVSRVITVHTVAKGCSILNATMHNEFSGGDCGGKIMIWLLVFSIVLIVSAWVYSDAKNRGSSIPGLWGMLVFACLILFLPLYLIMRPTRARHDVYLCPHCGKFFDLFVEDARRGNGCHNRCPCSASEARCYEIA